MIIISVCLFCSCDGTNSPDKSSTGQMESEQNLNTNKDMIKLLLIIPLFFLISCQSKVYKDDLPKILGVEDVKITNSQGIDEFAGFGEGYTLEIYELSESTINAFINDASKILPEKNGTAAGWLKHDWRSTPMDSSYIEIFNICLNYYSGNRKLEGLIVEIKKVLQKPDVYYSFYYKPDKDSPQDVLLFILDLQSRKLYIMDQQT